MVISGVLSRIKIVRSLTNEKSIEECRFNSSYPTKAEQRVDLIDYLVEKWPNEATSRIVVYQFREEVIHVQN